MEKTTKAKRESFAGIPRVVMDHPDFINLPGNAVKLLLELARQYRGSNNGDLTASWSIMKNRGFKSKATLDKALKVLLGSKLITLTRVGRFTNPGGVCALYALSWIEIHECRGKLDVAPTRTPMRRFSEELSILKRTPQPASNKPRGTKNPVQKLHPVAPETVPTSPQKRYQALRTSPQFLGRYAEFTWYRNCTPY